MSPIHPAIATVNTIKPMAVIIQELINPHTRKVDPRESAAGQSVGAGALIGFMQVKGF